MASTASPETLEIRRRGRRRLVGAIVIVLLLVVFVPMVLDSDPRPARQEPAMAIPPREGAPPLPTPTPAARTAAVEAPKPPEPAKPAEAPAAKPEAPAAKAEPQAAKLEPKAAPAPKAPERAAEKVAAKAAAPKLEGFAIQVGAFRDEARLKQARDKLVAAGVAHYTERLDAKSGTLTRLRAGPFPTREAADAALAKTRAIAPDAKVVPLP